MSVMCIVCDTDNGWRLVNEYEYESSVKEWEWEWESESEWEWDWISEWR